MRSDSTPSLVYGPSFADKPGRSSDYGVYGYESMTLQLVFCIIMQLHSSVSSP